MTPCRDIWKIHRRIFRKNNKQITLFSLKTYKKQQKKLHEIYFCRILLIVKWKVPVYMKGKLNFFWEFEDFEENSKELKITLYRYWFLKLKCNLMTVRSVYEREKPLFSVSRGFKSFYHVFIAHFVCFELLFVSDCERLYQMSQTGTGIGFPREHLINAEYNNSYFVLVDNRYNFSRSPF